MRQCADRGGFLMMKMFTKEYWLSAVRELGNTRKLAFAALICAITVALDGLVKIPVLPGGLEIKVTFFVIALGCAVYGPIAGILLAAVVDTLSVFLFPTGFAYFPGYLLTEIIVSIFYSLFLYRQKITVGKLFCAKVCTNYLAHVALNALWASMLMDKGYLYYLWSSLIKNSILLPIEVLLMAGFFAAVVPIFARMKLLPHHSKAELAALSPNAGFCPVLGASALIGGGASLYFSYFKDGGVFFFALGCFLLAAGIVLISLGIVYRKKKSM